MENFIQKQWEEKDGKLYKAVIFKDFQEAFAFLVKLALLAEKNNHHPKISNEYNKVELWLCTHDMNNSITDKDLDLAKQIDELLTQDLLP